MTSTANERTYRIVCLLPTDLSTLDHERWRVESFADHRHPDEALKMARHLQAAHIDAIEQQRAKVLCELTGGEGMGRDYDFVQRRT